MRRKSKSRSIVTERRIEQGSYGAVSVYLIVTDQSTTERTWHWYRTSAPPHLRTSARSPRSVECNMALAAYGGIYGGIWRDKSIGDLELKMKIRQGWKEVELRGLRPSGLSGAWWPSDPSGPSGRNGIIIDQWTILSNLDRWKSGRTQDSGLRSQAGFPLKPHLFG